ncbi:PAS domain-containing sensor histidine kinase [Nocardioides silvaticus]|uniref:histidine kinase n=1 Tax=Nocardioides silvaticus TaxID=2201891 RepID=A0A316TT83_9ACTN|nr:PAS domain-containing sensor histidine kinase [Nocardioides silvaticus]PWN02756.1 PAS domain-containing sensor histidine kinase [Nocardioides silvaticus]
MPLDVLDALPDGVVVAGPDGRVLVTNAAARRMLGITEDLTGMPLVAVLALSDHDGNGWVESNAPYAGLPSRKAIPEQTWLLPDGTEVLVAAALHRAERGGPVEMVAVSLRSGRGRARLDRERSDLVATVAHELRSPLTGVRGFVHALINRWEQLNDEQKKLMLTTVAADADRLSRLIAELLDVARIDTGRLQMHPRPCDLVQLSERVVASVRHAATSRTITLHTEEVPPIAADPDKVTQVVTNLVENAVRHGEGDVTVTIAPDGADSSYVAITVTDEGDGIPAELRGRVFTKFWTASSGGGSGLGLYIVNGLVRAHGGTVLIEDRPGGGASVTATWPVHGR